MSQTVEVLPSEEVGSASNGIHIWYNMANGFDLSLEGILAHGELNDTEVVNA